MSMFDDAKNQAQKAMEEHGDQVEEISDSGLDRASEAAGSATGGRFDEQIQQGRAMADERFGNNGDTSSQESASGEGVDAGSQEDQQG
ncbi:antitoxin [Terrabacter carboxydivorans]|uniref:Antitoxin n=1 Tax=Terrabacter carboxydivorans TaxID=619730 RepID=A0ABP5Y6F3_9MICO